MSNFIVKSRTYILLCTYLSTFAFIENGVCFNFVHFERNTGIFLLSDSQGAKVINSVLNCGPVKQQKISHEEDHDDVVFAIETMNHVR